MVGKIAFRPIGDPYRTQSIIVVVMDRLGVTFTSYDLIIRDPSKIANLFQAVLRQKAENRPFNYCFRVGERWFFWKRDHFFLSNDRDVRERISADAPVDRSRSEVFRGSHPFGHDNKLFVGMDLGRFSPEEMPKTIRGNTVLPLSGGEGRSGGVVSWPPRFRIPRKSLFTHPRESL